MINETWYLLYDGSSVDGMGSGDYVGRTTDKNSAWQHYMRCKKNPYSTGYVEIVTDEEKQRAWSQTQWED